MYMAVIDKVIIGFIISKNAVIDMIRHDLMDKISKL